MTREEFDKFVAGDERIAAVVKGTRKAPKDEVLWSRGQEEEVDPERWIEDQCWARPARPDCMLARLDWWLTGKR